MLERRDYLGVKLVAAHRHIELIRNEHTALIESDDCAVISDLNARAGYLSVKVDCRRPPPPEWSVHVGEALYQFRSTLDHLACLLAEKNGQAVDDITEFPIFLDRADYWNADGTLTTGVKRRIGKLSLEDQAAIEREQPFNRTNGAPADDPLWLLYRLSNYDRHQFFHLVEHAVSTGYAKFTPGWFGQHVTHVSSNFGPFEGETEVAHYTVAYDGPQVAVQVNSHVTFEVAFGQPGPAAGLSVIGTLRDVGIRVTEITGRLLGIKLSTG